ncbi:Protein sly1 [Nosema bombycis CQ1]|uniref:Protein sly1 n=1 Tax=Nosema bombycis (strain CQ1 / CVCC 102059) TaxID=578461 RepID=R0M026_NOSB1|nr:Protein sly1 [Nosema bombycis CQ1]|eukprot:EOB11354.1 Protein sly1 [Nosema bombycis CQ1]
MDLKKSQKNKIINDVFKGDSNSEWSILIYDQSTAKIMTNLFTQSELITHNIVLSQRIEEKREKADFPVVYFVLCTKENLKIINQEYDQNQYNSFRVCSLNQTNDIDLNPNIPFKIIFMNYVALEDKVFLSSIPDIYSVANTLNLNFYVEFTLKSLEFECKKLDESFGEERNGKILIFDRSLDLFTPLGHFFTFQAFLMIFMKIKWVIQGVVVITGWWYDRGVYQGYDQV